MSHSKGYKLGSKFLGPRGLLFFQRKSVCLQEEIARVRRIVKQATVRFGDPFSWKHGSNEMP